MVNAYFYSNVAVTTTLSGGINGVATTATCDSTVGWPTSYPFIVALDYGASNEELIRVTNNVGNVLTFSRGFGGTSAVTHSAGAKVQCVYNAVDATDFRTHESSSSGVHGLTGTVVGTSDVQTLTNKTLTAPGITNPAVTGGGSLAGTFSGSPTFSGGLTFSGAPSFTGGGTIAGSWGGNTSWTGNPTFTGAPTFTGGASFTTNAPLFSRTATNNIAFRTQVAGDTANRWHIQADGQQWWGPGGAATQDTNLYRDTANSLKTDDNFTVAQALSVSGNGSFGGNLSAANMTLGSWPASWSPLWSTVTGLHLPSYGNAVVFTDYAKIGRLVLWSMNITFGSSTSFGSGATNNDNWQFSVPGGFSASTAYQNGQLVCGSGLVAQGAITVPIIAKMNTAGDGITFVTGGAKSDNTAMLNQGAIDSVTPWNWASTNALQASGFYESAT